MKIRNKKNLLTENYLKIIIEQDLKNDISFSVLGEAKSSNIDTEFDKRLKECKDDYQVVIEILKHFLTTENINCVMDNVKFLNRKSKFIKISSDTKELYLSLNNKEYMSKILSMIYLIYYNNFLLRVYLLIESEQVKSINIIESNSRISFNVNKHLNEELFIRYINDDVDLKIIIDLLKYLISNYPLKLDIKKDKGVTYIGNISIISTHDLTPYILEDIKKHNSEKIKKKEGYYGTINNGTIS